MGPYYKKICSTFEEISRRFDPENDYVAEIASLMEEIEKHRTEFRDSGVWRTFQPKDVEQDVLIATSIDSLLKSLSEISLAVGEINQAKMNSNPILMTKEA